MTQKYVTLGGIGSRRRLYFADIPECCCANRLQEWLQAVRDAIDDILAQLDVYAQRGGDQESLWYLKAVKALTSYRQAENRIKKRLRLLSGVTDRVAA